jgi:hypothetical protein
VAAALTIPAASAAGCSLSGPAPDQAPARGSADVDPDVALLDRVAGATATMVALYEGVVERHRGLRRDLRPLLAAHRAHAAALGDAAPSAGANAESRGRVERDSSTDRVDVPARETAAVRQLRAAEREASGRLLEETRAATSGAFARLLASMSAASAQHVQVLREVGR